MLIILKLMFMFSQLDLYFIEIFLIFFLFSIYITSKKEKTSHFKSPCRKEYEIVITSLNESESILRDTIKSWMKTGKRIVLLRDGKISKQFLEFLRKNGIVLISRKSPVNGKAGALNNYLKNFCKAEYFLVVDADERFSSKRCLESILCKNADVVISAKEFDSSSLLSELMNSTNNMFHTVQAYSSLRGIALFNGSLGLINSKVAKSFLFRDFKIEDIEFSLRLIEKGHSIKYVGCIIARGLTPSLRAFLFQHFRYSYGTGEVVRAHLRQLIKKPFLFSILMFLPFFSLFQSIFILYVLFFSSLIPFLIQIALSYIIFLLYLKNKNPVVFALTYFLNLVLLPIPRTLYFVIGFLKLRSSFNPTLSENRNS